MKQLIFIAAVLIGMNSLVSAQTKEEDLSTLMEMMGSQKQIDDMVASLIPVFQSSAQTSFGEESEAYQEYFNFLMEEVGRLSKKMMDEVMVPLYDKHFTQEEIRDLITFYRSSTGQKMLSESPKLMQEMYMSMMTTYLPELQQKLQEKLEE